MYFYVVPGIAKTLFLPSIIYSAYRDGQMIEVLILFFLVLTEYIEKQIYILNVFDVRLQCQRGTSLKDPGSSDPGSNDPGSIDPGSIDPGSINNNI